MARNTEFEVYGDDRARIARTPGARAAALLLLALGPGFEVRWGAQESACLYRMTDEDMDEEHGPGDVELEERIERALQVWREQQRQALDKRAERIRRRLEVLG